MSRLTKEEVKECATSVVASQLGRVCGKTLTKQIITELLEYKCIEEELGIDLITLFKALKNGVYYDIGSKTIRYYEIDGSQYIDIDIQDQFLNLMYVSPYEDSCHCEMSLALDDYGKTWALTKEELENEEHSKRV